MTSKRSADPSPQSVARAGRQRVAAEEGVKAMADFERKAVDVRKNMARLRTLREAAEAEKKAENAILQASLPPAAVKKKRKPKTVDVTEPKAPSIAS